MHLGKSARCRTPDDTSATERFRSEHRQYSRVRRPEEYGRPRPGGAEFALLRSVRRARFGPPCENLVARGGYPWRTCFSGTVIGKSMPASIATLKPPRNRE